MIKLLIFDLDGTIIDTKSIHSKAFLQALHDHCSDVNLSEEEHVKKYDSLTTFEKLTRIEKDKSVSIKDYNSVKFVKDKITKKLVKKNIVKNTQLVTIFQTLKDKGYKLAVASNAGRAYVKSCLKLQNILDLFDIVITRDDVENPKPHCEMFLSCMLRLKVSPKETLIFEDSLTGLKAGADSSAFLASIESPEDLNLENILRRIDSIKEPVFSWPGNNIDIVIPMAGAGSRFANAGFKLPKPMIDVLGRPMIDVATSYLKYPNARFIFIVQKSHNEQYMLTPFLKALRPNCEVIEVDGLTEGAACTVLTAKNLINSDRHLIIANCDQYIDFKCDEFIYEIINTQADGASVNFIAEDKSTKWSYARLDESGHIVEVAEKKPISTLATCGVYHFRRGADFVRAAESMIRKDIRINNEFYVAPVYNELIAEGAKINNFLCDGMAGLGTPSDLEEFIANYQGKL